jgi:O-antigen ligase
MSMATVSVAFESAELDASAAHGLAVRESAARTLTAGRVALVATLTLATLAFGAVQAWSWGLMTVLAAATLLLWAWAAAGRGLVRIAWTPLYVPAAVFLLVGFVQFAGHFTADLAATRESLVKLVADLLIFFLACQLWVSASPAGFRRLGVAVTLLACGLAFFSTLQFFASPGMLYGVVRPRWGGWIFGPYVNHNHYAGLMEMLIPVALGYVISQRPRREIRARSVVVRALRPLAILVAVASVLLSGSRGGMIALGVEAALFVLVAGRYLPEARRRRLAVAGIAGVAASAALFLWLDPGQISRRLGAVADLSRAPEATLGERRELARDALHIFRAHPWTGAGLGSFATVYPRYRSFASDLEWDHAHNDYAEALAETGVAGGVAIVVALALFVALAFQNLGGRLKYGERGGGWIRLGAAIGCCGLLVHSLGDFNLHIPANAAWFAFCAGIAVGQGASSRRGRNAPNEGISAPFCETDRIPAMGERL